MASLIKKKKGNRLYYYLVESARVDGRPRIVYQAYLGTAEKLAELIQERTAPVPLSATLRDFGLRLVARRSAHRRMDPFGISVACSSLRTRPRSLSAVGGHASHL
jgi:hypothetical protein